MRHLLAAATAAFMLSGVVTAFAADPTGSYSVVGQNPGGGSQYRGSVTVERTGQTYRVIWVVGDTKYVGTGIGNKDFIAVTYRSGNSTGLALYGAQGGNWQGVWANAGGREIGTEVWERE